MSRYCRICDCHRPNEAFSGKGHRICVCKECARLPKEVREAMEQTREIAGYLRQSCISKKNRERLQQLGGSPYPEIAQLAAATLTIAGFCLRKLRRWRRLAELAPASFLILEEMGLVPDHYYECLSFEDDRMHNDSDDEPEADDIPF